MRAGGLERSQKQWVDFAQTSISDAFLVSTVAISSVSSPVRRAARLNDIVLAAGEHS
jgi:hypothetical protein